MTKSRLIALALAVAAGAVPGPALAFQDMEPVYNHYYYNDSQHSAQVGIYHGDCTYWGAVEYAWLEGSTSAYDEPIIVAYCDHGQWYPI